LTVNPNTKAQDGIQLEGEVDLNNVPDKVEDDILNQIEDFELHKPHPSDARPLE
jgi:hypothetical protein